MAGPLPTKTYDSRLCRIFIVSTALSINHQVKGFVKENFLNIEKTTVNWARKTGADGQTTRSKMHENTSMITLTLEQSSDSNKILDQLSKANSDIGEDIFTLTYEYGPAGTGGEQASSAECYIEKPAIIVGSSESSSRVWVIFADNLVPNIIGLGTSGGPPTP